MNTITNGAPGAAQPTPPTSAPPSADRDIPALKTKRKSSKAVRLAIVGGVILMIGILSVSAATFMQRLQERKQQQRADQAKVKPVATVQKTDFESVKKRIKAEETVLHPETTNLPPPATAVAQGIPVAADGANFADAKTRTDATYRGTAPDQRQASPQPETPQQRRLSGDVLVVGEEGAGAAPSQGALQPGFSQAPQMPPLPNAVLRQTALEEQLKPSKLEAVAAARRRDLSMLLPAGTSIPCGQRTYIVSTNPGQASCIVSKDVYSANGATLLIERGSHVVGERLQALQLGQEMMPVLWHRIDTPRGVVIDIDSLATDPLGASGLPVDIDNHWGQRFGAAIMLSLISDLGQAAANAAGNADGTIRLTTTAGAGQDLAAKALEKTINIPPTGRSLQGSAINIFVARDVDFRSVYELVRY